MIYIDLLPRGSAIVLILVFLKQTLALNEVPARKEIINAAAPRS